MADWAHKRTDITIRAAGALSCATAYLAIHTLGHLYDGAARAEPGVVIYLLAAIAFLCSSFGAALLLLGHHVLDRIEVSARWQRMPASAPQARRDADGPEFVRADALSSEPKIGLPPALPHIEAMNEMPPSWRSPEAKLHVSPRLQAASQW
ncbi:hypothetical protein [Sphingomonas endolithica]|uniref:hypothetical protein n=1 Tax=Sphingomonas endolithica TaxID=2972485 RepID=UPI0021B01389|nr:hypothetical protein [Sphingomonas sp. ZFBP2030]